MTESNFRELPELRRLHCHECFCTVWNSVLPSTWTVTGIVASMRAGAPAGAAALLP